MAEIIQLHPTAEPVVDHPETRPQPESDTSGHELRVVVHWLNGEAVEVPVTFGGGQVPTAVIQVTFEYPEPPDMELFGPDQVPPADEPLATVFEIQTNMSEGELADVLGFLAETLQRPAEERS